MQAIRPKDTNLYIPQRRLGDYTTLCHSWPDLAFGSGDIPLGASCGTLWRTLRFFQPGPGRSHVSCAVLLYALGSRGARAMMYRYFSEV
jgi:hypothetical protein